MERRSIIHLVVNATSSPHERSDMRE